MITSFDLDIDVLSDMLGFVVEKKNPAPKEGESLQLYIPVLMPNISKSIPTNQNKVNNKGSKLFLNDSSCRPTSRILLTTQNYITGYVEKNSKWVNESTSEIGQRTVENADGYQLKIEASDSLGLPINISLYEEYKTYYTEGNEKVSCYAPNGKLSKLLFNNDMYL